ncbi:MAG: ABC transporter permease [Oscillospiraceae bacterium]|jgi:putative ABC transport system permease protein|nr:ABC transporter permease [Oscillospiraceae bacterium]
MNLLENMRLALSGLRASKMRSFLTMLGIIIGISSVIAIVTIGTALTAQVTDMMASFGVNNIDVMVYSRPDTSASNYEIAEADRISDEMIENLMTRFPREIEAVSVSQSGGSGQAKEGRNYANVRMSGVNEGYAISSNFELQKGRFINDRDVKGGKNVAVVSDKLVNNMFGPGANPLGKEIKVHNADGIFTYAIIGVYKYEMSAYEYAGGTEKDITTAMYLPITTVQRISNATKGYDYITVAASSAVSPSEFTMTLEEYFNGKVYNRNTRYMVRTFSNESWLNEMTTMLTTMSLAISIIAAISLLVGGIGVMNIMLVSVTERTREIGTRKALGARSSAIRAQFIVEAMIICLIGGVIGVILGLILGNVGATLMQAKAVVNVSVVAIAVLFSMTIGIFFGYYPANKAAKLDPIEALRYE